ncbi:Hypothetical protein KQS_05900 [Flavobacterium indicum GPTSA100-9 = DSM 17447]|uniref:Uncharacterized protein n=1 Tax=Flavobacterium indicum (strain DSM 17447 / CIP 109464 / GPTSA100-9) TaxID=1094466 RepID=H8XP70_FLAIG|nr:Hypothetical protein KQS_05900 [Flavobacterium indicum GPTSA100-9 = DSM 17447]
MSVGSLITVSLLKNAFKSVRLNCQLAKSPFFSRHFQGCTVFLRLGITSDCEKTSPSIKTNIVKSLQVKYFIVQINGKYIYNFKNKPRLNVLKRGCNFMFFVPMLRDILKNGCGATVTAVMGSSFKRKIF